MTDQPEVDALTLDANAVAGLLYQIFGAEMTASMSQCAHCGNRGEVGTLRAYVHAPGIVLRCSVCSEVVVRVMRRPDGQHRVDARGAAYFII
jgi:ribosomal protein L24E